VSEYVVVLNGRKAVIPQENLTVGQLRALFDVPADWALVNEGTGDKEDRNFYNDNEVVSLEAGPLILFTRPPTMFGVGS